MPRKFAVLALGLFAVSGLLLAGCSSADKAADSSHVMVCPTCETVWVGQSMQHGSKISTYHYKRDMACPGCDKAAKAYFEQGKLIEHDCPDCKVTPKVYTSKPITSKPPTK